MREDEMDRSLSMCWLENVKGRDHMEDVGIAWKITLEWILWK
jgi:hypothetical protein